MLFVISITIFTLIYFYIYILFVILKIICLYNPNFNGHFKNSMCPSEVNLPIFHMLYYIQIIFKALKFKLISIIEHLVCFVLNLVTKMIFFFSYCLVFGTITITKENIFRCQTLGQNVIRDGYIFFKWQPDGIKMQLHNKWLLLKQLINQGNHALKPPGYGNYKCWKIRL